MNDFLKHQMFEATDIMKEIALMLPDLLIILKIRFGQDWWLTHIPSNLPDLNLFNAWTAYQVG